MRVTTLLLLLLLPAAAASTQEPAESRGEMFAAVEKLIERTADETGVSSLSESVADAVRTVPRHHFVPDDQRDNAYRNRPLPIGYGQTISQPYIVALMTELLDLEPGGRTLELGTGSGYQAALLAAIVNHVYSIEIVPELAERASQTLPDNGFENVTVRQGDGYHGWPENAPFDAIVVTAAADHVPPPLIQQLAPGGRLVLPLGNPYANQTLTVVEKLEDGSVRNRQILPVRFVPLTRGGD